MFWSKIWFFLVAVAAAVALTIALSLPRPAERETRRAETIRLKRACGITNILLQQNARDRIDLASAFARADAPPGRPRLKLDEILYNATKADRITSEIHNTAKLALGELVDSVKGSKPDFVIAVDATGRAIARVGLNEDRWGDSVRGFFAIDDALDGYLRDDVWFVNHDLYRIAVSPVIETRVGQYAGAIVIGHAFNKELAERLADNVGAHVAFYAKGGAVAASTPAQVHQDVAKTAARLLADRPTADDGTDAQKDCADLAPFEVASGSEKFDVAVARLPGEARAADAFYAVFIDKPDAVGFMGTLRKITRNDLSFDHFPWIKLGLLFVVAVGIGMALMVIEADRPMRRLAKDALALAQGETSRLDEMRHKGKFGSVARSINIALDKLERDAKSAKRDLDSLLGPAPKQGAHPVPAAGPTGPSPAPLSPPPPSEFRFSGGTSAPIRPPTEDDKSGPAAAPFDLDLPPPPPAVAETPPPSGPTAPPVPAARLQVHAAAQQQVPPPPIELPKTPTPEPRVATPRAATPRPNTPRPNTPPPLPATARTPAPVPDAIDDDILGIGSPPPPAPPAPPAASPPRGPSDFDAPTVVADPQRHLLERSASEGGDDGAFRKVFDEFRALKEQCGESVASLTYEKFAAKLRKNRDALIAKHGCKSVRFQVYIKDGKAALKATPVKS
ncbi:MAG: hypothetical protein D6689_07865 [Deltaproteobacteria bacterium]|nr:MAG: hypothetical protein D6689_07865 [Deltaproteobacteria bacterium]